MALTSVTTESGTKYVFGKNYVVRYRSNREGGMRMDAEAVPLISMDPVVLGKPMKMVLKLKAGVITLRETSPVTSMQF